MLLVLSRGRIASVARFGFITHRGHSWILVDISWTYTKQDAVRHLHFYLCRVETVVAETSRTTYFLASVNFSKFFLPKFLISLATHRIFLRLRSCDRSDYDVTPIERLFNFDFVHIGVEGLLLVGDGKIDQSCISLGFVWFYQVTTSIIIN